MSVNLCYGEMDGSLDMDVAREKAACMFPVVSIGNIHLCLAVAIFCACE